jgi:low temperature requirement protein LtrA
LSDIVKTGDRKQCEERVTPIELFFDLVFMFAIAQVTSIQGEGRLGRD